VVHQQVEEVSAESSLLTVVERAREPLLAEGIWFRVGGGEAESRAAAGGAL
jgi:hypothetical protein